MLCTLGVSSRREQCSGATPAVPHLALVLQATWWVVDISADTANIRCRIIVGVCAEPNHAKAVTLTITITIQIGFGRALFWMPHTTHTHRTTHTLHQAGDS